MSFSQAFIYTIFVLAYIICQCHCLEAQLGINPINEAIDCKYWTLKFYLIGWYNLEKKKITQHILNLYYMNTF